MFWLAKIVVNMFVVLFDKILNLGVLGGGVHGPRYSKHSRAHFGCDEPTKAMQYGCNLVSDECHRDELILILRHPWM